MNADKCIYVGNINPDITESLLYEIFLQAGPLEDVTVKDTFAFVTYEDEESIPYACSLFEGLNLFGTQLNIRPRQKSKYEKMNVCSVPPLLSQLQQNRSSTHQPCENHRSDYYSHHEMNRMNFGMQSAQSPYLSNQCHFNPHNAYPPPNINYSLMHPYSPVPTSYIPETHQNNYYGNRVHNYPSYSLQNSKDYYTNRDRSPFGYNRRY